MKRRRCSRSRAIRERCRTRSSGMANGNELGVSAADREIGGQAAYRRMDRITRRSTGTALRSAARTRPARVLMGGGDNGGRAAVPRSDCDVERRCGDAHQQGHRKVKWALTSPAAFRRGHRRESRRVRDLGHQVKPAVSGWYRRVDPCHAYDRSDGPAEAARLRTEMPTSRSRPPQRAEVAHVDLPY